jgi:hypothetical protein
MKAITIKNQSEFNDLENESLLILLKGKIQDINH